MLEYKDFPNAGLSLEELWYFKEARRVCHLSVTGYNSLLRVSEGNIEPPENFQELYEKVQGNFRFARERVSEIQNYLKQGVQICEFRIESNSAHLLILKLAIQIADTREPSSTVQSGWDHFQTIAAQHESIGVDEESRFIDRLRIEFRDTTNQYQDGKLEQLRLTLDPAEYLRQVLFCFSGELFLLSRVGYHFHKRTRAEFLTQSGFYEHSSSCLDQFWKYWKLSLKALKDISKEDQAILDQQNGSKSWCFQVSKTLHEIVSPIRDSHPQKFDNAIDCFTMIAYQGNWTREKSYAPYSTTIGKFTDDLTFLIPTRRLKQNIENITAKPSINSESKLEEQDFIDASTAARNCIFVYDKLASNRKVSPRLFAWSSWKSVLKNALSLDDHWRDTDLKVRRIERFLDRNTLVKEGRISSVSYHHLACEMARLICLAIFHGVQSIPLKKEEDFYKTGFDGLDLDDEKIKRALCEFEFCPTKHSGDWHTLLKIEQISGWKKYCNLLDAKNTATSIGNDFSLPTSSTNPIVAFIKLLCKTTDQWEQCDYNNFTEHERLQFSKLVTYGMFETRRDYEMICLLDNCRYQFILQFRQVGPDDRRLDFHSQEHLNAHYSEIKFTDKVRLLEVREYRLTAKGVAFQQGFQEQVERTNGDYLCRLDEELIKTGTTTSQITVEDIISKNCLSVESSRSEVAKPVESPPLPEIGLVKVKGFGKDKFNTHAIEYLAKRATTGLKITTEELASYLKGKNPAGTCSKSTVSKLLAYRTYLEEWNKRNPKKIRTVPHCDTEVGSPDSTLTELIEDQDKDFEPSPLDDHGKSPRHNRNA